MDESIFFLKHLTFKISKFLQLSYDYYSTTGIVHGTGKKIASNVRTFRLASGNGLFVLRCPFFTGALVFASWVNVEMFFF